VMLVVLIFVGLLANLFQPPQRVATGSGKLQASEQSARFSPEEIAKLRAEAEAGASLAQLTLARAYEAGNGVPENKKTAAEWYEKAAEQGNSDAQNELGVIYLTGDGLKEDKHEAMLFYEKSARQGNASAMFNLGAVYYNGSGVPIDDVLSYSWFVLAQEAGSPQAVAAVARAESELRDWQITLGYKEAAQLCEQGKSVPHNQAQAAAWWLKAAARGDSEAQVKIGNDLLHGQGVPQDSSRALYWCSEAGRNADAGGEYCLGYIYQHALGVSANVKAARHWYEAAADQNDTNSIRALAQMDEAGEGTPVDLVGAFVLYAQLAVVGDNDALHELIRLRTKMTAEEWNEVPKRLPYYHVDPQKLNAALQSASD
jgi:uncharacterized protein